MDLVLSSFPYMFNALLCPLLSIVKLLNLPDLHKSGIVDSHFTLNLEFNHSSFRNYCISLKIPNIKHLLVSFVTFFHACIYSAMASVVVDKTMNIFMKWVFHARNKWNNKERKRRKKNAQRIVVLLTSVCASYAYIPMLCAWIVLLKFHKTQKSINYKDKYTVANGHWIWLGIFVVLEVSNCG